MLIKNVRLSYPNLFKAKAFEQGQDPRFDATFIIEKDSDEFQNVREAINEVIKAKWGSKPAGLTPDRICLKSGKEKVNDDGTYKDGYGPDVVFFRASTAKRPGVYDADRSVLTEQDGKPYAGCYVNAQVNFWAQDNKFGKRINAELLGVQFVRDGDSFGGGSAPAKADDFPELEPQTEEAAGSAEAAPWDDGDDDLL